MQASLKEMIAPGALVLVTPLVVGILFGTRTLAGLLAGALVSGVQMAVSMSNTGGAWDNAKKMIEVGAFAPAEHLRGSCMRLHVVDLLCDVEGMPSMRSRMALHAAACAGFAG
jgi:inorganic pyrophosphatase